MFDFFRFSVLLLVGLHIFSAAGDDCPKDECAATKPAVDENGNILMTIWYDNDDPNDMHEWNANMIRRACQARKFFKNYFHVEYIVGAGSRVSGTKTLICKYDCDADRRDGCAAMLLNAARFAKYVCCTNNGEGSDEDCAKAQGIQLKVFSDCINKKHSDQLLMDNGNKRRSAGIPGCHLPEFAFNNVIDRCIKISTYAQLTGVICNIFENGNMNVEECYE